MIGRRLLLLMLVALRSALSQSSHDLHMMLTAQIDKKSEQLKITWSNQSGAPFLLNIGSLVGDTGFVPNLQLSIKGPGGVTRGLRDDRQPSVIGGRAEPLVICLLSQAEYSIEIPLIHLLIAGSKEHLSAMKQEGYMLRISFKGVEPFEITPDRKKTPYPTLRDYPVNFMFWTGVTETEALLTR